MAEPDTPPSAADPPTVVDTPVTIQTVPLADDHKVLVFVEANAHVTHVIALDVQGARDLVVGLLEAIDIADPADSAEAWWDRP